MKDAAKPKPVKFDWNEGNKEKNWHKHRVDFRECEQVFFNQPLKIFYDKKHSQKEPRFVAFGKTDKNRKLMIVFTLRVNRIRIISARNQSRKEGKIYEQKQKN
ncbi:MAG TPA: BrnT family toxin [Candidatus Bathyarchaeia archaeon]|nr:BrnT family toxin [Candidatus Bathyarchaeia archaeon]